MKKAVLFFLLAQIVSLSTYAYDFVVDGIYYHKISGSTVAVTYKSNSEEVYHGIVNIPDTVVYNGSTYSVTTIGYHAFAGCSRLTSVSFPNSLTDIESAVFVNCTNLKSLSIPSSISSISGFLF